MMTDYTDETINELVFKAIVPKGLRPENPEEIDAMLDALGGETQSEENVQRMLLKYSKLIQMPIEKVRAYLAENPGHKAAGNALRELERDIQNAKTLASLARKTATVSGRTRARFAHKGGRRAPTKRELG